MRCGYGMPHHHDSQSSHYMSVDGIIKCDWATKTLVVPKQLRILGVEGDKNCRSFPFEILRAPTDIDFTHGIVKVVYTNANGYSDEHLIEDVEVDDANRIRFEFVVPEQLAAKTGKVYVGLSIIDSTYEWHLSPQEFYIGKYGSFSTELTKEDIEYDIVNQILLKQKFLESWLSSGNDVDLDSLLEIFQTTKLSYEIGEFEKDSAKPEVLRIIPEIVNGVVEGYHLYMLIDGEYHLLASSDNLIDFDELKNAPTEFTRDELSSILDIEQSQEPDEMMSEFTQSELDSMFAELI